MGKDNKDILGLAISDYEKGCTSGELVTLLKLPGFECPIRDTLPLAYLFRTFNDMPPLEQLALKLCRGKILDVGCGAGSHSLYLLRYGQEVTALDSSAGAVATSRKRGVQDAIHTTILDYHGMHFDTLLLLMNGIGLAGRLNRLPAFLCHLKGLLKPNGQILVDSSDIRYMYQDDESSTFHIPQEGPYYGEGEFIMEYQGKKSRTFPWLYLDPGRLEHETAAVGLKSEIIGHGEHFDYLARLT